MSLPWVKLHIPLLDNEDYKRFSPQAQHLYMTLLMLAGKQDRGDYSGRLETATGPLTITEVRFHARYSDAVLRAALEQLLAAKFVDRDVFGTLTVARFREKAAPLASTRRTREYRDRERSGNASGTDTERVPNAFDLGPEVEVEVDRDLLRKSGSEGGEDKDLAAYRILDAVYPVVLDHHRDLGMTQRTWRNRNKAAALDFVAQGKSPDEIVARLRRAYAKEFYRGIVMLAKLSEHWAKIIAPEPRKANEPAPTSPRQDKITEDLPLEERRANLERLGNMVASVGKSVAS